MNVTGGSSEADITSTKRLKLSGTNYIDKLAVCDSLGTVVLNVDTTNDEVTTNDLTTTTLAATTSTLTTIAATDITTANLVVDTIETPTVVYIKNVSAVFQENIFIKVKGSAPSLKYL